jgi:CubicO group peptidase (beta-lactamase class C family)
MGTGKVGLACILAAAGLVAVVPAAQQPPAPIDAKRLRELLEPIRVKHDLPALGAAVVRGRGVEALAVVGVRKHGSDVAAHDDDRFHLGSDTKPWTALLIAWLIEQGLLDWDTPLLKVFPDLADSAADGWKGVTLTHLLTHRAGLPANLAAGWWSVKGKELREQREDAVRQALKTAPKSEPGTKYLYSNFGYVVLGAVAERVGKASYEDLLKKAIFDPLGMKEVGFGPPGTPGKIDQPLPHNAAGKPLEPTLLADNAPVMSPAGRLHASLAEWSKFAAEELNGIRGRGVVLRRAGYRKLDSAPYRDPFCALGAWVGYDDPKKTPRLLLAHDGSNTFNFASAMLFPDEDLAVLVVTNQGTLGGPGQKGCHEARDQLLKLLTGR